MLTNAPIDVSYLSWPRWKWGGGEMREKEVEEVETDAKGSEARNKSAVKSWTHAYTQNPGDHLYYK